VAELLHSPAPGAGGRLGHQATRLAGVVPGRAVLVRGVPCSASGNNVVFDSYHPVKPRQRGRCPAGRTTCYSPWIGAVLPQTLPDISAMAAREPSSLRTPRTAASGVRPAVR
jgi:hypothetical protein